MGNSLKALRKKKGWTLEEAAAQIRVSRGHYIKLERGERRLNETTAARAARAFKVSRGSVLGDLPLVRDDAAGDAEHYATTVEIPEYDVRAGASYAGGISQEEIATDQNGNTISRDLVRAQWGFPEPFIRQELGAQPSRLHVIAVRGDSMNATLVDGDRAVIDLDDCDVSPGGVFALVDDNGSLIIKQLELIRNGSERRRIRCTSRNPNYAPFELDLDEIRIIGRVACKITKL